MAATDVTTVGSSRTDTQGQGGVNVGDYERLGSTLGGAVLALYGITRGSWAGMALAVLGGTLVYRGVSGHCQMYEALGINRARVDGEPVVGNLGVKVERNTVVKAPPEQVYRFWRTLENLPRFMSRLESVQTTGDRRSHWVVRGPAGTTFEWDAEIINDVPGKLIAWRSTNDADVEHAGSVHFEPTASGDGTIVRVSLQYGPPGGVVGHAFAALWGEDAGRQIEADLAELKRAIEAGATGVVSGQARRAS